MAPNEHEFHESDEKFLAPGAATFSNTALQRGGLVSGWGFQPQPTREPSPSLLTTHIFICGGVQHEHVSSSENLEIACTEDFPATAED